MIALKSAKRLADLHEFCKKMKQKDALLPTWGKDVKYVLLTHNHVVTGMLMLQQGDKKYPDGTPFLCPVEGEEFLSNCLNGKEELDVYVLPEELLDSPEGLIEVKAIIKSANFQQQTGMGDSEISLIQRCSWNLKARRQSHSGGILQRASFSKATRNKYLRIGSFAKRAQ